jgi:hypothetical protein
MMVGEKSPFHSLTAKKANEKRTLVLTPDNANSQGQERRISPLPTVVAVMNDE